MTDAEEKTAALLATLWVKIRPLVEERLATLDEAAAAAKAGSLADDLRKEARGARISWPVRWACMDTTKARGWRGNSK